MSEGNCKRRRSCSVTEKLIGEEEHAQEEIFNKVRDKTLNLHSGLFKDDSLSYGGAVKCRSEVMVELSKGSKRPPNMSCRVESFGRICQKFDDRRKLWVVEMGFGGLLQLAHDMQLPRLLAYWLMTRIDPIRKMFITPDGGEFRLSKKQIRWVLGIPMGSRSVPSNKTMCSDERDKVQSIFMKYGKSWVSNGQCGRMCTSVGIPLNSEMMDRLEGHFDPSEEEEFKTLFLILALEMIFYLDRLDRDAVDWDVFPRLNVWNMHKIRTALKLDKVIPGDFGRLGLLDVAYGEQHPREARDTVGPKDEPNNLPSNVPVMLKFRKRRGRTA